MKKFLKNRFSFLSLIILGFLFFSLTAFAVDKCSLVNWPKSPVIGTDINPKLKDGKCKYADLTTLIKYLYEWGISLGGLLAFIALVIAGFQYLTSVGDPTKMKDAKDRIISAFFGLTLLLGSWLILNQINPQLTSIPSLEFNPPEKYLNVYESCENDKDCKKLGPEYKCQREICFPNLDATKNCERATISGSGIQQIFSANNCVNTRIPNGAEIHVTAEPEGCYGILMLYKGRNCSDKNFVGAVTVKGGETTSYKLDEDTSADSFMLKTMLKTLK